MAPGDTLVRSGPTTAVERIAPIMLPKSWAIDVASAVPNGDEEVQPPFPGPQVRDVSDPQPVRRRGSKLAIDEILRDANTWHRDRCSASLSRLKARDPSLSRQPLNALSAQPLAVGEHRLGMHPGRAVDPLILSVNLPRRQGLILSSARAEAGPAHRADRELGLLREHHLRLSRAKKAAALSRSPAPP